MHQNPCIWPSDLENWYNFCRFFHIRIWVSCSGGMLLFLNGKSDGEGGCRSGASVKKKNCSKDGNVLPPVPSPHPCNSENPCIMEARVCSRKNIKLRDEDCWIDHISRLPDELLVSILSLLSLKEAAASSILSRRWRFLWTFISKLDFEGSDLWTSFVASKTDFDILHFAMRSKREASIHENLEYVLWVDSVLGLRDKSAAIKELRISFNLNKTHQSKIDGWIRFALTRKVVCLDLNLVNARFVRLYNFPVKVLCRNKSYLCGFKELRLIRLVCVALSDGALEIICRSCHLLEEIFLSKCERFSTVKIVNPLPALKRLTVIYCSELESVEVRDSKLVYFKYRGHRPLKHFLLKNVPLLVEMDVGRWSIQEVEELVVMFSSCQLAQLEKLTVAKEMRLSIMEADMMCSSVKMSNLKQLVWRFVAFTTGQIQLEGLTILVGALPLLERLVIMAYADAQKGRVDCFYNSRLRYKRTYAYSHLKQVEYVGYHSHPNEMAVLTHFLENAPALEEVIIHPPKVACFSHSFGEYSKQDIDTFRAFAKAQLTPIFPSTVTLKIL